MSDEQEALRGRIKDALEGYDRVVTAWVLAYETSGITGEGELGNGWGSIHYASDPTAVGLCRMVASTIERQAGE